MNKHCWCCQEDKPEEEFHKNRAKKDGLTDMCKPCNIQKSRENYASGQATQVRKRRAVLELLGGRCNWSGCDWEDDRALQIDHIYNNGAEERRRLSTAPFLQRVLNHPEEYQLLCANHNWIKRLEEG